MEFDRKTNGDVFVRVAGNRMLFFVINFNCFRWPKIMAQLGGQMWPAENNESINMAHCTKSVKTSANRPHN